MQWKSTLSTLSSMDSAWVALGLFEGQSVPNDWPSADLIASLQTSGDFACTIGETLPLFGAAGGTRSILLFGLGRKQAFHAGTAYQAGVAISKRLSSKPRSSLAVALPSSEAEMISSMAAGLVVGTVGPGLRKLEKSRHPFEMVEFIQVEEGDPVVIIKAIQEGRLTGEGINLARELVNLPPADKTPEIFADFAAKIALDNELECEVWDRSRLSAERFGGVLAVASGSDHDPRFVQMRYRGAGEGHPVVSLVGKGVTFDSGGLSLKPSASMEDMKCDMAGAATVLATIQIAAKLELPVNVDASFALTENMTGGRAMKLGDVITMRNGLTVEVLNTDAEGRLILADVLSYVTESRPALVVDLATLTGACMVALGNKVAGLFANSESSASAVLEACRWSGERAWRMPMDDDYGDLIKSKVAEIKNVGGKWGGAITAAKFLQRFVGDSSWAHLDIAGPSWADEESSTRDAGGTGCFVRTLVTLLKQTSSRA